MNEKPELKNQIERYLRMPFYLAIFLALVNVPVYFVNINSGVIVSIGIVVYCLLVLFLYFHFKPDIMSGLISFAFEQGQVQKELLKDLAIPYTLVDTEGRLLWANPLFMEATQIEKIHKKTISQILPDITKELLPVSVDKTSLSIVFHERNYRVELKRVQVGELLPTDTRRDNSEMMFAVYLFDETELCRYIKENRDQKLIAGLVYIDNYEEALESIEEVRRSLLIALIDRKVSKYMQNIDAIVKKLEKDKYLVIFQQKYLSQLQATKFAILDEVRSINIGNELAVTLSIGLGVNAEGFGQAYDYARIAMDIALGRGGDQAVVKDGEQIYYYGGKTQGVEKSTRVKARVKAHALRELLETKDQVIIMGHKLPDVDCIGAGLGIYRLATTLNKKAHIVINEATVSIRPVINNFIGNNQYEEDLFLDSEQAMNMVDANTAVVVVDVNRPSYTECEELLSMTKAIVVLDHHRQTSETIENASLSYIEPYASSACEMIAEILQYIVDKPRLRPIEADAMYAGILVDTDNFVTKTGVRTFEAASYLKRSGADVVRVRKMFRANMDAYKQKIEGVRNSEVFLDDFALSILPTEGVDSPTVIAAQVANELLDVDGVKASFVLTFTNNQVYISARSIDEVNVQVVMEHLGGGGHATVAGAQLKDCSVEEGMEQLKALLTQLRQEGDL